jgi:RNA polymerase sigma-70 factor (ECF subfamily)
MHDEHSDHKPVEQLVAGCIAGDRRCQHDFFRAYHDRIFGFACHFLGPGFDFDDVVQQVFIRLFKSLGSFKGTASLDTWVYRIASNVCTDQLRNKYRKRRLDIVVDSDEQACDAQIPEYDNPYGSMERKELAIRISRALALLSEEKRTVIVMHEMEHAPLEQIADVIRKPVGTVKSRLFHARKELQKHLSKYLDAL